ncbi:MAG TPA: helix-turn-helix domain-containing protein [Verrucomicrobiae bacterium]|nr:helix-turn-helix domain-containing protein [Verrucomicrobiae bacterium]
MSQIHKSRASISPYIDTIWKTQNISDGVYLATPDGSWDLIVLIHKSGARQMLLAGQATKPQYVPYQAGTGSVVISFASGAYMPFHPADTLTDSAEMLPNLDDDHFMLAGHAFEFPTFENAEQLVDKTVALKILKNDAVVEGELRGAPKAMSERAKQRHFSRTTGLTKKYLNQIKQAQRAIILLQQGKRPIDAAIEAGYTDQPHLAKSLKKIMNSRPSNIDEIHKL